MAISKKIPDKKKVDALLERGGRVKNDKREDTTLRSFHLRLTQRMIDEIDHHCSNDFHMKKSRHSWIVEAILEKLAREEKST